METLHIKNNSEEKTCILCGDDLEKMKDSLELSCDFCNKTSKISHQCKSGHLICDSCLEMPTKEFIKNICLKYKGINPIELAVEIMNSPVIRMHGPEHHFIVPAVLTTCLINAGKMKGSLEEKLEIIERRALKETPQACSYDLRTCGAAIGTGVFLSVFLDREQGDEDEWSVANQITAESLKKVAASGGPRCCKRDTYLSLESAIEFLKNQFAIDLPKSEAKCTFSLRNKSCKREDCNFYNLGFSLV